MYPVSSAKGKGRGGYPHYLLVFTATKLVLPHCKEMGLWGMRTFSRLIGCLALWVGSCFGAGPKFEGTPTLVPNPNPAAPQAGILTFEAAQKVKTTLRAASGDHEFEQEFGTESDPADGLAVVGMRPDRTYRVEVVITDASGTTTYDRTLTLVSPALPDRPELMPSTEVEVHDARKMEGGYTLFNPRRRIPLVVADAISAESEFNANFGMLLVVDSAGEVVWQYRSESRITDYRPISNGNIVFITADNRLVKIDTLGNTVASWCARFRPENREGQCPEGSIPVDVETIHHSFHEYPNGDFLILSSEIRIPDYYTSETDAYAPRKTTEVVGDVVLRMTREGEILWQWKAFDHLDPFQIGYLTYSNYWARRGFPNTADWSHANAVRIVDDGASFLVNFRLISGIAKVDVETQDIKWMATSDPEKLGLEWKHPTFKLADGDDWFWMPHAPWITDRGTLLLFNNDNFGARPFDKSLPPSAIRSRAEEYAFDEEKLEMRKIWQSRFPGEEPLRSWAMGSVQPLDNGNVLAGYGLMLVEENIYSITWPERLGHPAWTQIREYDRSDPAPVV